MKRYTRTVMTIAVAGGVLGVTLAAGTARAQEWSGAVDRLWGTPGNWSGADVPDTAIEPATFDGTGPGEVDLSNVSYAIEYLNFSAGDYSILDSVGSAVLTVNSVTNAAGDNTIQSGLTAGGPVTVSGGSLTLANVSALTASQFSLDGGALTAKGGGKILPVRDGLEAWYDASYGVDVSGATVTNWADRSGNGRNLVIEGGTPTLLATDANGLPAIEFNASGENLQLANPANEYFSKETWLVFRSGYGTKFGPDWSAPFGAWNGDDLDRSWMFQGNTAAFWNSELPEAVTRNGVAIASTGNFDMSGGGTEDMGQLMVLRVVTGSASGTQTRPYVVGTRNDSWSNGSYVTAEILSYNRVLSASEQDAVGGYLAAKYGITTSYPALDEGVGPGSVALGSIPVDVTSPSTIGALATNRAAFGDLAISNGATLVTTGSAMGFESTTIGAGATAVGFDTRGSSYLFRSGDTGFHNDQYPLQVHRDGPADLGIALSGTLAPINQYMVVKIVVNDNRWIRRTW